MVFRLWLVLGVGLLVFSLLCLLVRCCRFCAFLFDFVRFCAFLCVFVRCCGFFVRFGAVLIFCLCVLSVLWVDLVGVNSKCVGVILMQMLRG